MSLRDGASARGCVDLRPVDPRLRAEDFGMMVSGRDVGMGGGGAGGVTVEFPGDVNISGLLLSGVFLGNWRGERRVHRRSRLTITLATRSR